MKSVRGAFENQQITAANNMAHSIYAQHSAEVLPPRSYTVRFNRQLYARVNRITKAFQNALYAKRIREL